MCIYLSGYIQQITMQNPTRWRDTWAKGERGVKMSSAVIVAAEEATEAEVAGDTEKSTEKNAESNAEKNNEKNASKSVSKSESSAEKNASKSGSRSAKIAARNGNKSTATEVGKSPATVDQI